MRMPSNGAISEISTSFALRNLKQIHLTLETFNQDPTLVLISLLRHAPDVKTVFISLKNLNSNRAVQLLNKLIDLKEEFVQTKILLSRRTLKEARCLNCVPYQIMYMWLFPAGHTEASQLLQLLKSQWMFCF